MQPFSRHLLHASRHAGRTTARPLDVCARCWHLQQMSSFRQSGSTTSIVRHNRAFSTTQIRHQTFYDLFPDTFAQGPPPRSPFSPDLRHLRREFLRLQAKAHPDLAAPEHKRQAEAASATINEAYKTLQDPLARARYLLSLEGVDLEDDSMKMAENELLMEVMEAREAVEEVEDEDELAELRQENQERIDATVKALEQCFASGDFKSAAHHSIKLRYWNNIAESIHGWEQGNGGGSISH